MLRTTPTSLFPSFRSRYHSQVSNELEVTSHQSLTVGDLVQRRNGSSEEGELLAISRTKPGARFSYMIQWLDGVEGHVNPNTVQKTQLSEFPAYDSAEAQAQIWSPGLPHYWVDSGFGLSAGSCLFCGRMRGKVAARVFGECAGPARIELR